MSYCNKCGKEIEEGKKYCEECEYKEEIKSEVVINTSVIKEEKPKKAMGTAGILSIIFGSVAFGSRFLTWLPMVGQMLWLFKGVALPLAIAGIVCGAIAKKKTGNSIGLTISIITTVLEIFLTIVGIVTGIILFALGLFPTIMQAIIGIISIIIGSTSGGDASYMTVLVDIIRCML